MTLWRYITESGLEGEEFDTMEDAYRHAEARYWDRCSDRGVRRDTEEIILTEFEFNDNREPNDLQVITDTLEYHFYKGDYAEHNTLSKAILGVS